MDVRLSSNESPFGPSPAVIDAIRDRGPHVHLYPDDQSVTLRAAIAESERVPVERVAVGNGSAALLMDLIAHDSRRARGSGAGAVLTYERAFIVYALGAQVAGMRLDEAPLGDRYARDPAALLGLLRDDTRVVCIDNPANPTGAHLTGDELGELLASVPDDVTVVIDEAYHHFASGQRGYATVAQLGVDHPRLLVLRTFSKAFALAGLRVGYLTGPRELVAELDAARTRFNVNAVAQVAAVAALQDRPHLERTITGTVDGRARMVEGLRELGVDVVDGLGNFVLIELGRDAGPVVEAFAAEGVGVRPLAPYRLGQQIRVSVGTPAEVDAFLTAARSVLTTP